MSGPFSKNSDSGQPSWSTPDVPTTEFTKFPTVLDAIVEVGYDEGGYGEGGYDTPSRSAQAAATATWTEKTDK